MRLETTKRRGLSYCLFYRSGLVLMAYPDNWDSVAAGAAIPASVASVSRWCVLRMAGPRTLAVARSLAAAGFDVWTPVQKVIRRAPRTKASDHVEVPYTPTYVFVRDDRLDDLIAITLRPVSPHPRFSIFHHRGEIVRVRDAEIAGLRSCEAESQRRLDQSRASKVKKIKARGAPYTVGDPVGLEAGPFAGLSGRIVESGERKTLVMFGSLSIEIETSTLRANGVATVASAA